MLKEITVIVVSLALLGIVWISWQQYQLSMGSSGNVCSLEAKQCPDGSYVGRTGPKCEFAECPSPKPVVYNCAEKKSITATFTGDVVEFYVSDGRSRIFSLSKTTETEEGGTRYANLDNSAVLWVKDYSAFLEENGKTTFSSCVVSPNSFPDVSGSNLNLGIVTGTATLGPRCPVMKNPPEPECADTPYAGKLVLTSGNGERIIREFVSGMDGSFVITVPAGNYEIYSAAGVAFPRCTSSGPIFVSSGETTETKVNCDTGIR